MYIITLGSLPLLFYINQVLCQMPHLFISQHFFMMLSAKHFNTNDTSTSTLSSIICQSFQLGVWHTTLILKLKAMVKWLGSYMANRMQCVVIDDKHYKGKDIHKHKLTFWRHYFYTPDRHDKGVTTMYKAMWLTAIKVTW